MQLAGELAKMNLASLIRLVRNSELTGKICLTQGVSSAFIFFDNGQPIHVESDYGVGRDALLDLFLWQTGSFSYIECPVKEQERSLAADEPLEKMLKEGLAYQDAVNYLERLRINLRTVFKATDTVGDDLLLPKLDGRTPLGDVVQRLGLSRSQYVPRLQKLISAGKVLVVEAPSALSSIQLPDWVISRLKQDNPDVSQSIVDLVIWADRIKCWLYQADVDLSRVIGALEEDDSAERDLPAEPEGESFQPSVDASYQPAAASEMAQDVSTQDLTSVETAGGSPASNLSTSVQSSSDTTDAAPAAADPDSSSRQRPRPPSYEF